MRRAALAVGATALAVLSHGAAAQTAEVGAAWEKNDRTSAVLALAGLELLSSSVVQGSPYSILISFWRDPAAGDGAGMYRCFDLLDRAYSHAHCEVAVRDE